MTDTPLANEVLPEAPVQEKPEFTQLPPDVANTIFRFSRPNNGAMAHLYEEQYALLHRDGDRLGMVIRDRVDDDYSFVIYAVREQRCGQIDLAVSIPTLKEADATMRRWMVQKGSAQAFKTWLSTQEYSENQDLAQFAASVTHDSFWNDWPADGHLERLNAYILQYKKFDQGDAAGHMSTILSDAFDLFLHLHTHYR
jgi:hypothetical protein